MPPCASRPDYPRHVYVVTSGSSVGPNVAGIEFGFADASYLAGLSPAR